MSVASQKTRAQSGGFGETVKVIMQALLLAFNFEYINDTMTGGAQPRITSYYSGSDLAMLPGPATGAGNGGGFPAACRTRVGP